MARNGPKRAFLAWAGPVGLVPHGKRNLRAPSPRRVGALWRDPDGIGLAAGATRPMTNERVGFTPPPPAEPVSRPVGWPRARAPHGARTRIRPGAACRGEFPAPSALRCVGRTRRP